MGNHGKKYKPIQIPKVTNLYKTMVTNLYKSQCNHPIQIPHPIYLHWFQMKPEDFGVQVRVANFWFQRPT